MSEEKKINTSEFNPAEYARDVYDSNGMLTGKTLDVKYRKLWFRTVFPNGKIQQVIHTIDSQTAVVEARVYADKADAPEAFLSNSFAQRTFDPNTEFGTSYLECAATAAVGRALADAGFGTQFCVEPEDANPKPVDSPVQVQKPSSPETAEPPGFTDQTPLEVILNKMRYEEAAKTVLNTTKNYKGRLLGEVANENIKCVQWIAEKAENVGNLVKGAAIIICRKHGVEVKV